MKIWVVMAKVEELQARSVDKVFNSKEAEQYSEDWYYISDFFRYV